MAGLYHMANVITNDESSLSPLIPFISWFTPRRGYSCRLLGTHALLVQDAPSNKSQTAVESNTAGFIHEALREIDGQ